MQRVDIEDSAQLSFAQKTAYNWGGPIVNGAFFLAGTVSTPLAPLAFVMATHRLGPNVFASIKYFSGPTGFTNDETYQFPREQRGTVALAFSILYLGIALFFLQKWKPQLPALKKGLFLTIFPAMWFVYLISLDVLDQKFF